MMLGGAASATCLLAACSPTAARRTQVTETEPRDALEPTLEAWRNLLVRVAGYNAYFVGLAKEIQHEIMPVNRTGCGLLEEGRDV